MQTLLNHLNPEQRAAVTLPNESALILAGAGSGKTRVLTTRIAWLIQTGQVSPLEVMAVTFTNKAAKEMQARLSSLLPINTKGMWIGTFHGLCHRLLRAHCHDAKLTPTFQILDSQDQQSMIKRILKAQNIDEAKHPARGVASYINHAKEQGLRARDVNTHDPKSRIDAELYGIYEEQCQRDGVVDFAELLLRSVELLGHNQPLREHYQARFKHILVDEFQDTNDLQYRWIKLMTGPTTAVFAVGDDDQSIYAFRGANVRNMASFEREFQVAHHIKLEQNYRSHGHILDAANALIAQNIDRMGKNLRTDAGLGEPIEVHQALTESDEALWVVEQVNQLTQQKIPLNDIAILYRSNAQSRIIEHILFSEGLPYRVYGGLRFFERAEIKHAMAYLLLLDNPHNDSAFLRVVNFPARGIGPKAQETLIETAKGLGLSLYATVAELTGKVKINLNAFTKLIDTARSELQDASLPDVVMRMLDVSTLINHYQNEKEGVDRIENLRQLVSAAALFIDEEHFDRRLPAFRGQRTEDRGQSGLASAALMSPLSAFLAHASLEAGDNQAQQGQAALQLMTVHAAKGLEFDAVFITGLEEGLFPHEGNTIVDKYRNVDGLEEERRLMYVATTRAKRRLFMSYAQRRMLNGKLRYGVPSRFLSELPSENVKRPTPITPHLNTPTAHSQRRSSWSKDRPFFDYGSGPKAAFAQPNFNHRTKPCTDENAWCVGLSVKHERFGEGTIVKIESHGKAGHAHIKFRNDGLKILDLSVAKLEKV